jgi:hypothetical protein
MRNSLLAVGLLILPAAAACGGGQSSASSTSPEEAVPAGVAEQYSVLAEEVAEHGGQIDSGDWTVSYIVEKAEPWYESTGADQRFREPTAAETHHIEIIPTETATGRIVPDVPVTLAVVAGDGTVVDEKRLHFLHSTFFHYANNFEVPEDGHYTLRATLGDPTFARHGEAGEAPALDEGTRVEFEDVDLTKE